jgi:predicted DNA-binding transcriptional regulator AlpA
MSSIMFLPEVGFVREPVVLAHVGLGRTKWREMVQQGQAPAPQKWGERLVVYDASAIRSWIAERAAAGQLAKKAA